MELSLLLSVTVPSSSETEGGADLIPVQGLLDPVPVHGFFQVVHLQQKDFSE